MREIIENTYYFYTLAAVFTVLVTFAINKIPALKSSSWSKSLPLVFGRTISIQVGAGCLCLLVQALLLGSLNEIFSDGYTFLLKGTSIAGIAMVVENLFKVLFSKEYSANIKILNNEKFKQINELLTANYSGYNKLTWLQKFGVIVAIDLDINNLLAKVGYNDAYERFKNILREYISVDFLNDKIKELYAFYEEERAEEAPPPQAAVSSASASNAASGPAIIRESTNQAINQHNQY
jgi:hypothetical protein